MNTESKVTLPDTLRRVAGATAGEWKVVEHSWAEISICSGGTICMFDISGEATEETQDELAARDSANAEAIVAAVNYLRTHGPALEALVVAARAYYEGYCQDEAADECGDHGRGVLTGCDREQRDAARALRTALRDMGEET